MSNGYGFVTIDQNVKFSMFSTAIIHVSASSDRNLSLVLCWRGERWKVFDDWKQNVIRNPDAVRCRSLPKEPRTNTGDRDRSRLTDFVTPGALEPRRVGWYPGIPMPVERNASASADCLPQPVRYYTADRRPGGPPFECPMVILPRPTGRSEISQCKVGHRKSLNSD